MKHPLLKRINEAIEIAKGKDEQHREPDVLLVSPLVLGSIKAFALEPEIKDYKNVAIDNERLMGLYLETVSGKGDDYMVATYWSEIS